jgi:predicted dehydrogenase
MERKIRWGIMGLGKIAHKFTSDLLLSENSVLYAVASRDIKKAKDFGKQYHSVKYFGSYEDLAKDPNIDIVYISTPHALHFHNTMMCLKSGKSVLCEKPMGMNAQQVKEMMDEAQSRKLFLMEGLWTRFIPATEKFIELLEHKVIGDILFIRADFGFQADFDPVSRVYNKELGAGSLLDIGIYPVYLSLLALGIPQNIKATARYTSTGVDAYCAMLFEFENAAKAKLESTIETDTPTEAYIYGTDGYIKMHSRFHHTEKISVFNSDGTLKNEYKIPYIGNGYLHEIEEVNACLQNGKTESPKLTHQTSIYLISILDRVRKEIGLEY